jgi:mannose-1-phosphate guanylyltransferase
MRKAPELYAVLLAGGSGTRFWPASRRGKPKQYLRIAGEQSMLAETAARLEGIVPAERTYVVTVRSQLDLVRRALPGLPEGNLLAEPLARNTGPCVALAALEIALRDPASLQVELPADHVIHPRESFQRTLLAAARAAAATPALHVFGIRPTHPATAYGWILAGRRLGEEQGIAVHAVERFVEKPDLARARGFLEHGGYYWNSGMFVWSSAAIERALSEHLPAVHQALSRPLALAELERAYAGLPQVSIDVGVLERERDVRMLPIDYFWSDVGSWDALAGVHAADERGNVASGGALLEALDARGCIVHGDPGALIALIGVEDLVVVQSGGVTLVCRRERAQEVKQLVERLARARGEFL